MGSKDAAERINRAIVWLNDTTDDGSAPSVGELAVTKCVDVAYEVPALLTWIDLIHEQHEAAGGGSITLSGWQAERLFALADKVREAFGNG